MKLVKSLGMALGLLALLWLGSAQATLVNVNFNFITTTITGTLELGPATTGGLSSNVSAFDLTYTRLATNATIQFTGTSVTTETQSTQSNGDALCMAGALIIADCPNMTSSDNYGIYMTVFHTTDDTDLELGYDNGTFLHTDPRWVQIIPTGPNTETHNWEEIPPSYTVSIASPDPTTVPEPATLALMGLGLAGLGFSRRRRGR